MSEMAWGMFFGAGFLMVAWAVWGLVCNEITYRQRMHLVSLCIRNWQLYLDYCEVSYEQHCRALMMFLNPYKLYGESIRAAANPTHTDSKS
jgi:hypothetical protein